MLGIPRPVGDILGTAYSYTPPAPIERKPTPIAAICPNNEHLLSHIADLLIQHNVLQTRPELIISEQSKRGKECWSRKECSEAHLSTTGYLLLDTNKNIYEIAWLYGTEEANKRDIVRFISGCSHINIKTGSASNSARRESATLDYSRVWVPIWKFYGAPVSSSSWQLELVRCLPVK